MRCPQCNQSLLPLTLKTHLFDVAVDYCAQCGGVWTDEREVNYISKVELIPLTEVLPHTPITADIPTNKCPHDQTVLTILRGDNVPQDLTILQCPRCKGIWFPKKSIFEFKNAQEAKINYFKTWKIPLESIYSVLLPLLIIAVIGGGIFITVNNVQKSQEVRTKADEIITKPVVIVSQVNKATISFRSTIATTSKIRYWINPNATTETDIATTPQTIHTIVLTDLIPNKKYSYQIIITSPQQVESSVYSFTTK